MWIYKNNVMLRDASETDSTKNEMIYQQQVFIAPDNFMCETK